jgi:hypothetical protein
MITSGITIGINKQDGAQINIAIDPVNTNKAESGTANEHTYKLYRDTDSAKTFDKGYLGAITLDGTDNSYHYAGGTELTDFELNQLVDFIRGYRATGKEFDDHNRDITTK